MLRMTVGCRSAALTVAVLLAGYSSFAGATTTTTYIGADGGSWTVPGNWNNGVPNSSSFDAVINDPLGKAVQLIPSSQTINKLTLTAPNRLQLFTSLSLAGNSLVNSGTISFMSACALNFNSNATLSGGGTVLMLPSSQLGGLGLGTRLSTDNVISGAGFVGGFLITNSGTITATNSSFPMTIQPTLDGSVPYPLVNSGVLRGDGGSLQINLNALSAIDNTGGLIESRHGSVFSLLVAVKGGTIRVADGGNITLGGNLTDVTLQTADNSSINNFSRSLVLTNVINQGLLVIHNGDRAKVVGTLMNSGTLHVAGLTNSAAYNDTGTLTLAGGGEVFMAGSASLLTGIGVISDNVIHGLGTIGSGLGLAADPSAVRGLSFFNSGTVTASAGNDPAPPTLTLNIVISTTSSSFSDVINHGVLRAGGRDLIINGQCDNTLGLIDALAGSRVRILKPVMGGTFLANGSISFLATTSQYVDRNQVDVLTGSGAVVVGTSSSLISNGVLVGALALGDQAAHVVRVNGGNSGTSKVNAITLGTAGDGTFSARLDVNDNKFIVEGDGAVPGDKGGKALYLQGAMFAGMDGGDYLGKGITSGTVAADWSATGSHVLTLALLDNADFGFSTFGGQSVDGNSLMIQTARLGDADLDGVVGYEDFKIWYQHALERSPFTEDGDFNHDGGVDGLDFDLWFAAAGSEAQGDIDGLGLDRNVLSALRAPPPAPVPEGGTVGMVLVVAPWLLRRRRRG